MTPTEKLPGLKLLVTGSRDWTTDAQRAIIEHILRREHRIGFTDLVEGGQRGVDRMAAEVGRNLGYRIHEIEADWARYGRAAGPIRNRLMLHEHPDIVLVLYFHDNLALSRGTRNMVEQAEKAGILTVNALTGYGARTPQEDKR